MKNKKGFTLIELLAVLIILAIVTLIVIPTVSKSIEESKKASTIESGNNLINAVEMYMVSSKKGYGSIDVLDSNLNYKGEKPTFGEVTIAKNGKAKMYAYINGYCLTKKYNEEIVAEKTTEEDCTAPASEIYENGEIVYFNVDTGTSCTDYTSSQSNTGVKSGCMKFHAFNDDGGDTVNLILDHNTTAKIKWVSKTDYIAAGGTESDYGDYGKNDKGPLTLLTQLKTDTESWQGTVTPTNYTMDQSTQTSGANYTIDYSDYKARLITANEIATITGNTSWDEKVAAESDRYYFHDNTQTEYKGAAGTNKYAWLFDNISGCTTYGCNVEDSSTWAYWTASSHTSSSYLAWDVNGNGTLHNNLVGTEFVYGVRPVIEVSKDSLE